MSVPEHRRRLETALADLTGSADAAGAGALAGALRAESERLSSSRFTLALVGERLAGKSTLANALLGNPILPARAVPTTALVHEVRWAEHPGASLGPRPLPISELASLAEGAADLDRSARVLVGVPAKILQGGVTLLDTPGTNDLSALGALVTYGILPDCDAVLLVLDATQPARRTELDFLRHRLPRSARDRTVAVLNKADLLGLRELDEARTYTEEGLAKAAPGVRLFTASAKLALERGDDGFQKLSAHLVDLLGKERARLALVRSAGEALRLGEALRAELRLRREAAELAEGEIASRLERLRAAAGGTRRAAHEACSLVDARVGEVLDGSLGRLAEFASRFEAALPGEIDRSDEGDLRRYLPFFLEDKLREFAEAEAARVEAGLAAVAVEALAGFAEKGREAASELDLAAHAAVKVEVDTTKYDIGVFAAGALGTLFLFKAPLVGLLLLAGAPVLNHVLKGKVAGRVREVAKEQSRAALRDARARVEERLRESVLEGARRIQEAVLAQGEEVARGMEDALERALAEKRGGPAAAVPAEVIGPVDAACDELRRLAEELAPQRV